MIHKLFLGIGLIVQLLERGFSSLEPFFEIISLKPFIQLLSFFKTAYKILKLKLSDVLMMLLSFSRQSAFLLVVEYK